MVQISSLSHNINFVFYYSFHIHPESNILWGVWISKATTDTAVLSRPFYTPNHIKIKTFTSLPVLIRRLAFDMVQRFVHFILYIIIHIHIHNASILVITSYEVDFMWQSLYQHQNGCMYEWIVSYIPTHVIMSLYSIIKPIMQR